MKKYTLIIIAVIFTNCLLAQMKQNNIWYFGYKAGIDFNSGQPIILNNSVQYAGESTTCISDYNGNLLFYSNGETVFNAKHDTMDNGKNLFGCASSTQGVLIVPYPGNSDLYYLFTTDCNENNYANGLRYNLIDISQNNRLGKIIKKNILLNPKTTEHLTAITKSNGYDFWILSHGTKSDKFIEYSIDCNGLDTIPSYITIGKNRASDYHFGLGIIKPNKEGNRIILTGGNSCELFDFNNSNGNISNLISLLPLDTLTNCYYGAAFSQNGNYLYLGTGCYPGAIIYQYDLSKYNQTDINNSKIVIVKDTISTKYNLLTMGQIKLAPDNKIYIAHYTLGNGVGDYYLGVINNPNIKGIACNYIHNGFSLNNRASITGLPNTVETNYNTIDCNVSIKEKILRENIFINNPVKDELIIQSDVLIKNVKIFTLTGQMILETSYKNTIDVSNISKGLYIIKAETNNSYILINKFFKY